MINLNDERPLEYEELHGLPRFICNYIDINDIKGKNILNIGCGFGWFELFALRNKANSIKAIDLTVTDLATARKHIKHDTLEFLEGSALDLPFEDGSFDTVVSWEVIEHIPKNTEAQYFKEIRRVLKKNGNFYLSTPYKSILGTAFDPAWWIIGHRHYTGNQLLDIGLPIGFTSREQLTKGGKWTIIALLNLYISKWIFRRPPFFNDFINKMVDGEFDHLKNGYTNLVLKLSAD